MTIVVSSTGVGSLTEKALKDMVENLNISKESTQSESGQWFDPFGNKCKNPFIVTPPIPEPEPVPAGIPSVNTSFIVEKGRSKYVGYVGFVVSTRCNEKAKGGS